MIAFELDVPGLCLVFLTLAVLACLCDGLRDVLRLRAQLGRDRRLRAEALADVAAARRDRECGPAGAGRGARP